MRSPNFRVHNNLTEPINNLKISCPEVTNNVSPPIRFNTGILKIELIIFIGLLRY
jgi:hypothetical protein